MGRKGGMTPHAHCNGCGKNVLLGASMPRLRRNHVQMDIQSPATEKSDNLSGWQGGPTHRQKGARLIPLNVTMLLTHN
jgi:hypothetical protein